MHAFLCLVREKGLLNLNQTMSIRFFLGGPDLFLKSLLYKGRTNDKTCQRDNKGVYKRWMWYHSRIPKWKGRLVTPKSRIDTTLYVLCSQT